MAKKFSDYPVQVTTNPDDLLVINRQGHTLSIENQDINNPPAPSQVFTQSIGFARPTNLNQFIVPAPVAAKRDAWTSVFIPSNFSNLISIKAICTTGFNPLPAGAYELWSWYGTAGEQWNNHLEINTLPNAAINSHTYFDIDLSSVITAIAASDIGRILIRLPVTVPQIIVVPLAIQLRYT